MYRTLPLLIYLSKIFSRDLSIHHTFYMLALLPSRSKIMHSLKFFAKRVLNICHCRVRATGTCIEWMSCGHLSSYCNQKLLVDGFCSIGVSNIGFGAFFEVL